MLKKSQFQEMCQLFEFAKMLVKISREMQVEKGRFRHHRKDQEGRQDNQRYPLMVNSYLFRNVS